MPHYARTSRDSRRRALVPRALVRRPTTPLSTSHDGPCDRSTAVSPADDLSTRDGHRSRSSRLAVLARRRARASRPVSVRIAPREWTTMTRAWEPPRGRARRPSTRNVDGNHRDDRPERDDGRSERGERGGHGILCVQVPKGVSAQIACEATGTAPTRATTSATPWRRTGKISAKIHPRACSRRRRSRRDWRTCSWECVDKSGVLRPAPLGERSRVRRLSWL